MKPKKRPFRYFCDRHNGKPHMWNRHRVTKAQVEAAFNNQPTEYREPSNVWVRTCTGANGQKMEIVYKKADDHLFIITAYYI